MDTERFVGQKVLAELRIDRIVETATGIEYILKHDNDISRIFVPASAIKESQCKT